MKVPLDHFPQVIARRCFRRADGCPICRRTGTEATSRSAQHDVIERVSWSSCSSQTRRLNSHKCFSELRFAAANWPQETHLNTIAFTTGLSDMTVSAYIIRVGRDGVQVSSWCLPAVVLVADFKNTNRSAAHSEIVAFFNSQPSSRRTAQVAEPDRKSVV